MNTWGHNADERRGDNVSQQRMSVREAADLLGISPDGVRMRVTRGSMESEKDESGRVWVWVDTSPRDRNSGGEHSSEEVESLREQVGYLRGVIDQRDAELARAHQLAGESLNQLRALSAPASSSEAIHKGSQTSEETLGDMDIERQDGPQNRVRDIALGGALAQGLSQTGSLLIPLAAGAVVAAVSAINGEFLLTFFSVMVGAVAALTGFVFVQRSMVRQSREQHEEFLSRLRERRRERENLLFYSGMSEEEIAGEKNREQAEKDLAEKLRQKREETEPSHSSEDAAQGATMSDTGTEVRPGLGERLRRWWRGGGV